MIKLRGSPFQLPSFRMRLCSTAESVKSDSAIQPKEKLVNRWITFWKMLVNDYQIAIVEIGKSMKNNPIKTAIWSSVIGVSSACCIMNPDETHYRDDIIRRANELIFIGQPTRNSGTLEYLKMIEWFHNCKEIKRISLGVFSLILHEHKSKDSALYKDNCSYIKPSFIEMYDKILDIGFWNKWWMLEKMMVDYDINPDEWK